MAGWKQPSTFSLGTAAFGMVYGIANPPEKPTFGSVETMLDQAWEAGITTFDTAPAYGEAEQRLGIWIASRRVVPHLVTKLPSLANVAEAEVGDTVERAICGSTSRLGAAPATYLAHDIADYLRPSIHTRLHAAVKSGDVGGVGVSVYTETDVFAALAAGPPDAMQLPISAFDQRMLSSGALAACAAARVVVFARSIFLQGVLLMQPEQLLADFEELRTPLIEFDALCTKMNTTRASVALRFVRDLPGIASTVIGAYAPSQLAELVTTLEEAPLTEQERTEIAYIAKQVPERLVDPRTWPICN